MYFYDKKFNCLYDVPNPASEESARSAIYHTVIGYFWPDDTEEKEIEENIVKVEKVMIYES